MTTTEVIPDGLTTRCRQLDWVGREETDMQLSETNGAGALVLPGFFGELSQTGYRPRDGMTFEEWKSDGHKLHVVNEGSQWAIGDWWVHGSHSYGDRAKAAADGIFGLSFGALRNYGTTARSFEMSRRRDIVPFSFHQELTRLDPITADQLLERAEHGKWTRKQLRQAVKKLGRDFVVDDEASEKGDGQLVIQSLSNEHYTPGVYIEAAREVMNGIDLDPASCAEANEVVRAKRFFSESDDGLSKDWRGSVWLNPPYGRQAGDFVAKLKVELAAGRVTEAVVLVNAHCTDTAWFQPLWDGVLCFTDHRINFYGDDERSGSTHGSVFAYFGPRPVDFAQAFRQFGAVVKRVAL
jgi:hypothetical protein